MFQKLLNKSLISFSSWYKLLKKYNYEIDKYINNCKEKNIPELIEASKTIFRWKEYILNY